MQDNFSRARFECKKPLLARRTRPKGYAAGRPSAARDDRVSCIQAHATIENIFNNIHLRRSVSRLETALYTKFGSLKQSFTSFRKQSSILI